MIAWLAGAGLLPRQVVSELLAVSFFQNAFDNGCQDDFHGKAHLAGRYNYGVAS